MNVHVDTSKEIASTSMPRSILYLVFNSSTECPKIGVLKSKSL